MAPEINSSPNDALVESERGLGLEDPVPMSFPVADAIQTKSPKFSTIEELVSPGAAALRESNGSGKKPRYGSCILDFHFNFLENERTK